MAPTAVTVTTLADDPNVPIQGQTTLRDAIGEANGSNDASNTITFAAGLSGNLQLQDALPTLAKNIRIEGPQGGAGITVMGSGDNFPNNFGVFIIARGATCEIDYLGISKGYATGGGGIRNDGNLTLLSDTIVSNHTYGQNDGGGILNRGTLYLSETTVGQNGSNQDGGGIANFGILTLRCGSQITSNAAYQSGGGLFNFGNATATLEDTSSINGNIAGVDGGGIWDGAGATVNITGSESISDNGAGNFGGGIYVGSGS